jgi:hypothetical protein
LSVVPIALILLAGLFIGATGIGGVLVVPALTDGAGVAIDRAIAASMFGFLLTGIAAVALQRRIGEVRMRELSFLGLAALLGAASGAWIVEWLSAVYLRLFIAALAIVSGTHALAGRPAAQARPRNLSGPAYGCLGLLVGCGSALSGTGGPVLLIPILMALHVPIRNAIALAQAIQLPIALSATGVNAAHGRLDLGLGLAVGSVLVVGTVAGLGVSRRIESHALKKGVAYGLIALGLWYAYSSL